MPKKYICVGILAHVDAGKTTLAESMLYLTGRIRKPGRVDHRNTYLDTHDLERDRGITIFSKQAILPLGDTELTLLDTPGHADFSPEAERVLQALDYAILVISGTDGVQAHTETLWALLRRYQVPAFVFVSKMDVPGTDQAALMDELRRRLGEGCVDFSPSGASGRDEAVALLNEGLLEEYLKTGQLSDEGVAELIRRRQLFPCFFGSGLRMDGVEEFLAALSRYMRQPRYPAPFAARVFKIARDSQGNRLTYIKLTGGTLSVRTPVRYLPPRGGEVLEEKISQIRLYSGLKYDAVQQVEAGQVCAVTGLTKSWPGQGLGMEPEGAEPLLTPVLGYRLVLPKGCEERDMLPKLKLLEEEEPQLHVAWQEGLGQIHVQLMGTVQTEILKSLIRERFGVEAELDTGRILYQETIAAPVEGVGHFEPLRHYAEVHLLLEPGEPGSGIIVDTACSEDVLDRNWQRLILTHLEEKQHLGVLTGSPLTDVKITLLAGRAHPKHTEGGDFRQATYRAVRQGLMQAQNVLLEPYYTFELEVPSDQVGRAISDIRAMGGTHESPVTREDRSTLTGAAPVAAMEGYMTQVAAYTRGRGRLVCRPDGFRPCRNAQSVIDDIGYDPEADLENTPDSVFCAHGGGFTVKWNRVREYMHLDSGLSSPAQPETAAPRLYPRNLDIDEKELEAIMEREFGPIRRPVYSAPVRAAISEAPKAPPRQECVIVDGYNVIFAWDELKALATQSLDLARNRLMDMLASYQGYTGRNVVLVFDAYKAPGNQDGAKLDRSGLHVVYTKAGETADMYIEALAGEIGKNESVRVVTSDRLIRLGVLRAGILRTSSGEFILEVRQTLEQIDQVLKETQK
ncbi:MAG: NYN domain-containing protein [Oscillospiraceae bacterium]|nr:NYN domain-containing protein [Oscillospiraceae bacterium]